MELDSHWRLLDLQQYITHNGLLQTPQNSSVHDHAHSVVVSPACSTHPVKMPKPITSHPSSSSACYHHNVVSSHESSAKHTYPIVKSPEVPTVPASESSRAIDVFKTGSIFCNDDSLLVAGTLDNIPVDMTVDTGSNISIVQP